MDRPQQPRRGQMGLNRKFASGRAIVALILREMASRYGRSPGGYVWALLEPLGAVMILSLGFSLLLRSPSLGHSFVMFYATGFLPFNVYQELSTTVARSISFSRALLYYPAVTWVDAALARFVLNSLTGILVMIILLAAIMSVIDTGVILDMPPILAATLLAMMLGLGIGTLNCALFGLFPIWTQIWSIATRPLFLISGVFFLYEDLPGLAQDVLWYNPLFHVTGLMRTGFYPTYDATYVQVDFVIAVSLISLFFGVVLMGRYHRDILNSN